MMYADYAYYRNVYKGSMPEADFNRLSRQASAYLDSVTFGSIKDKWLRDEHVKDACCAVADAYLCGEQGGGIASESNDGVTVNYVAGVSKAKTDGQRVYEAAALYLGMTGLLYGGAY